MRPALPEEIRAVGAEPGYGSPLGVEGAIVVVDDAIPASPNLVAGANEEGFHFLNVNYGRDFEADTVADIASAGDGSSCPECGDAMRAVRGVEVGNILLLSAGVEVLYDDRRESLGAKFKDADLIGVPIRLTLTPRSLQWGGVEIKARSDSAGYIVSIEEVVTGVNKEISRQEAQIPRGDSVASAPDESPSWA